MKYKIRIFYEEEIEANNEADALSEVIQDFNPMHYIQIIEYENVLNTKPEPEEDIEDFVEEYRQLFPPHIKTEDGKPIRGDRKGCIKNMKWFFQEYPEFSRDEIMQSTKKYIYEKRLRGFGYMSQANYFIKKDGASQLAAFCEDKTVDKPKERGGMKGI